MTPDAEAVQDRIDDTLRGLRPGELVVRWALVVDTEAPGAARRLSRLRSEGSTVWEMEGLLRAACAGEFEWEDED